MPELIECVGGPLDGSKIDKKVGVESFSMIRENPEMFPSEVAQHVYTYSQTTNKYVYKGVRK